MAQIMKISTLFFDKFYSVVDIKQYLVKHVV